MHLKTWPWILSPVKTPGFESVATHLGSPQGLCLREMLPATWAAAPACGKLNHGTTWDECRCGSHVLRCKPRKDSHTDRCRRSSSESKKKKSTLQSWTLTVFQGEPLARLLLHPQNPCCSTKCWERWLVYLQNYSNHGWRMVKIYDIRFIFLYGLWYMFKPDLWCVFFMTVKHLCCMQLRFCWSFE